MNDVKELSTIKKAHELLVTKRISPTELLQHFFKRSELIEPKIKAWANIQQATAMQKARELEKSISFNEVSPLFAIPYGVKDIFYTKGIVTEAGSKILKGFVPERNATVINKLAVANAIMMGKTTTAEFASGGGAPQTRNPWNIAHTPGGSSTGSAAAVAAGMTLFSLGTQTSGSLSRPGAYNGLTVLKPTYGRISKSGIIPASWSLDTVGAFTKNVEDTVLVYNQIAGYDIKDKTTWLLPENKLTINEQNENYTIGVIADSYFEASEEIMQAYQQNLAFLQKIGFKLKKIYMPSSFEKANKAQQIVVDSECATYHYEDFKTKSALYSDELQNDILTGLTYSAQEYINAQEIRYKYKKELESLFKTVDVLVTPTTPTTAPLGILKTGSPIFNVPFTNAGVPTLTVPIGFSNATKLPFGMQFISNSLGEQKLIDIAYRFQLETTFHLQEADV